MNYQLLRSGFLPINIRTEDRIRYYDSLDRYASEHDLSLFSELVAEFEEKRIDSYISIVLDEQV